MKLGLDAVIRSVQVL